MDADLLPLGELYWQYSPGARLHKVVDGDLGELADRQAGLAEGTLGLVVQAPVDTRPAAGRSRNVPTFSFLLLICFYSKFKIWGQLQALAERFNLQPWLLRPFGRKKYLFELFFYLFFVAKPDKGF